MNNITKILIFGGAFNPPHVGHLHILKKAISYINPDLTLVSIDKISPWKKAGEIVPFSYRLEMIKNLFGNEVKYKIYQNDKNLIYSADIINEIHKQYNGSQLYFLIGQDQYELITTWNDYKLINELCTIICYKRGEKPINKIDSKHIILPYDVFKCCSSDNRIDLNVQQIGQKNFDYILKNNLYILDKIKKYMSTRRYEHTTRVLDTITQIAMSNNFNDKDVLRCQISATLHDIAKELSDSELKKIVSIDEINSFPSIHCAHGLAGSRLARKDFNINDEVILQAIDNHVIFKKDCLNNKVAKALFLADKLEPARTTADIADREKLFELACQDLYKAFEKVEKMNGEKYKC